MTINEMVKVAYDNSVAKGFHTNKVEIGTKLMLMVTELAEALEYTRKNKLDIANENKELEIALAIEDDAEFAEYFKYNVKDGFSDELADTAIRIGDLSGELGINLELAIKAKLRYNTSRPHMHGKSF